MPLTPPEGSPAAVPRLRSFLAPAAPRTTALVAVALVFAAFCSGCAKDDVAIDPEAWSGFLFPGQHRAIEISLDVNRLETRLPTLDILFLFDRTGSMGDTVSAMQRDAGRLMDDISSVALDARFAIGLVGDYALYGGSDTPWELVSEFTFDAQSAINALKRISIQDGGDLPEAYVRGFYESAQLSWRPKSRKYIIFFGDAPSHDDQFYAAPGQNFGGDPGRDGALGTADDLRMVSVLEDLRKAGIAVIPVHQIESDATKTFFAEAVDGFERIAQLTGGVRKEIGSPGEISASILAGIQENYVPQPVLIADEGTSMWLTPGEIRATPDSRSSFSVEVDAIGLEPGIYQMPVRFAYAEDPTSREIARSTITLYVGLASLDWHRLRWLVLVLFFLLFLLLDASRRLGAGTYALYLDRRRFAGSILKRLGVLLLLFAIVATSGRYLRSPEIVHVGAPALAAAPT